MKNLLQIPDREQSDITGKIVLTRSSPSPAALEKLSNMDFLRAYASKPGTLILLGGGWHDDGWLRKKQGEKLLGGERYSHWSHVLISQGVRADGHLWIIECDFDIDVVDKHVFYGVRECRADRYAEERWYPNLAVLDFGLSEEEQRSVVGYALEFITRKTRYSLWAFFNLFFLVGRRDFSEEREMKSAHCGSFIRTLFLKVGIDLMPELPVRWTTPEHIAQTKVGHQLHQMVRQPKWNQKKRRLRMVKNTEAKILHDFGAEKLSERLKKTG